MKPTDRFPRTDYNFRDAGKWRDFWPAAGGEGDSERRRFNRLTCELLQVSARERMTEMVVFGFVVAAAAWPVGYMIFVIVRLLLRGQRVA